MHAPNTTALRRQQALWASLLTRVLTRVRRWSGGVLLSLLAACANPPEQLAPPTPVPVSASPAGSAAPVPPPAGMVLYRIAAAQSRLHILVFRGGTMAGLGHNHVISSHDLQGQIWRGVPLENSGFEIRVPVNTLVVDDNAARAEEGEDFPLNVSADAKAGTKANMLRPSLLDGERFPEIRIRATRITGSAATPEVVASMRLKDQTRDIRLPVTLTEADGVMVVQGSFAIRQTDFGITPLRIAMGALTVQDTVQIKFRLVARVVSSVVDSVVDEATAPSP